MKLHSVDAYRVVNGADDGTEPGLAIDVYPSGTVIWEREDRSGVETSTVVRAVRACFGAPRIVLKRLASRPNDSRSELLMGTVPEPAVIHELGVRLNARIHPDLQTGVFLDARPARRWVQAQSQGRRILNLFAYAGAFTAHALQGGASRVTSVDAARSALARGRDNAALNGFAPDTQRWFADDALSVLRRADADSYDGIIMDPPAFGRAKGKRFVLRDRVDDLLQHGLRALAPGGWLLFCTHDPGLTVERLQTRVRTVVVGGTIKPKVLWELKPDLDFPGLERVRLDEVNVALTGVAWEKA